MSHTYKSEEFEMFINSNNGITFKKPYHLEDDEDDEMTEHIVCISYDQIPIVISQLRKFKKQLAEKGKGA